MESSNQDENDSVLLLVTTYGYSDLVEVMLDLGANPNKTNRKGETVLQVAKNHGYDDVVKILLERVSN